MPPAIIKTLWVEMLYTPETEIGKRDSQVTLEKLYEELDKTFFLICIS